MEQEEYKVALTERWEIVSIQDFMENVSNPESFPEWLEKQGFEPMDSYLEISVKIKAR